MVRVGRRGGMRPWPVARGPWPSPLSAATLLVRDVQVQHGIIDLQKVLRTGACRLERSGSGESSHSPQEHQTLGSLIIIRGEHCGARLRHFHGLLLWLPPHHNRPVRVQSHTVLKHAYIDLERDDGVNSAGSTRTYPRLAGRLWPNVRPLDGLAHGGDDDFVWTLNTTHHPPHEPDHLLGIFCWSCYPLRWAVGERQLWRRPHALACRPPHPPRPHARTPARMDATRRIKRHGWYDIQDSATAQRHGRCERACQANAPHGVKGGQWSRSVRAIGRVWGQPAGTPGHDCLASHSARNGIFIQQLLDGRDVSSQMLAVSGASARVSTGVLMTACHLPTREHGDAQKGRPCIRHPVRWYGTVGRTTLGCDFSLATMDDMPQFRFKHRLSRTTGRKGQHLNPQIRVQPPVHIRPTSRRQPGAQHIPPGLSHGIRTDVLHVLLSAPQLLLLRPCEHSP